MENIEEEDKKESKVDRPSDIVHVEPLSLSMSVTMASKDKIEWYYGYNNFELLEVVLACIPTSILLRSRLAYAAPSHSKSQL
jgi:hypothetical protein